MTDSTLDDLLDAASSLRRDSSSWLLDASMLSEAITESILSHPEHMTAVKQVVQDAALAASCNWIVGASKDADRIVRDLNKQELEPSRVLLFELVRITGSTIHQSTSDLRHVDVIPAVLVDLSDETTTDPVTTLGRPLKKSLSR